MTGETPRLAALASDGWELVDAEARLEAGDQVYWLPSRWEREHLDDRLEEGGYAKLIFRIHDPANPGSPVAERMWVTFDGRDGDLYHGQLTNQPFTTAGSAREGMAVWYRAEHVIDFSGPDGEGQASAAADVLHCERHGPSGACYLCAHLQLTAESLGFHTAADSDDPRPHAWCDACERLRERVGDWENAGDLHPEIRLVCGGCYDALRRHHERTSP